MNLSETESAVLLRLSPNQRENVKHFPPELLSKTLKTLNRVSQSGWNYEIARAKMFACVNSIRATGKAPNWEGGYMERSDRRKLAELASFMPPLPDWMKVERENKRVQEAAELSKLIGQKFSVPTSNMNGRGGFGD